VDAAAEHNAASEAASTAATGDGPPHYKLITEEELLTDASGAAEAKAGGISHEEDAALVALRRNISDIDAARMERNQGRMQVRQQLQTFCQFRCMHAALSMPACRSSLCVCETM
jgi:hypothetical protein